MCALYLFTTKKLKHTMCQVSLVVKYILKMSNEDIISRYNAFIYIQTSIYIKHCLFKVQPLISS